MAVTACGFRGSDTEKYRGQNVERLGILCATWQREALVAAVAK